MKTKRPAAWKESLKSQNWKVLLILVAATWLICAPVYYHQIAFPNDTDYSQHVAYAQQFANGEGLNSYMLAHPVLHLILAAMHLASGRLLGVYASLMVLQVLVQICTVLILYFWIGPADRKGWDWLRAGAALTLTLVAPVMLLAFQDGLFYFGYIGLANYHNPTIHLLKPFALMSFFYGIRCIAGEKTSWKGILLAALLTVLSATIKPNYAMSILPALALAAGVRWLQRRRVDWKLLAFGFFLPGLLSLAAQWLIAFFFNNTGEHILFAPFMVAAAHSQNLILKFLLSALFPILALLVIRRGLWEKPGILLGWAGFLAGAAQYYLLSESGERWWHSNFAWSSEIMLLLLFAVTVRWLLREKVLAGGMRAWEKIAVYGAYLAHLVAGIAYYAYCMMTLHFK